MEQFLSALAAVLIGTAAVQAGGYDAVPPPGVTSFVVVPPGGLPVRTGPGTVYAMLGAIPPGTILRGTPPLQCRPREDGLPGAPFCHIAWRGLDGWVSQAGLMPLPE